VTIGYTIIRSSNVFKAKAKLIAKQLWLQIRYYPGKIKISVIRQNLYRLFMLNIYFFICPKLRTVWWRRCSEEIGRGNLDLRLQNGSSIPMASSTACSGFCHNCGKKHAQGKNAICEAELLREYWDDYLHIQ
jgi:hypothetical protein